MDANDAQEPRSEFSDLLEGICRGDQQAAGEFTRIYLPHMLRVARRDLKKRNLRPFVGSDDVCQSVFFAFFRGVAVQEFKLDCPEQLVALLSTMVHNKVLNHAAHGRAQVRDARRVSERPVEEFELLSAAPDPAAEAEANDLYAVFLSRMSADEAELARQRLAGKNWPEIAAEVGCHADTARQHMARFLARFELELERRVSR